MEDLFSNVVSDPFVRLVASFAGVTLLTWMAVQSLPDASTFVARWSKGLLSAVFGPVVSALAYAAGFIKVDFQLVPGMQAAPGWVQGTFRVVVVMVLGLMATLAARYFHDWKVGSTPRQSAPKQ